MTIGSPDSVLNKELMIAGKKALPKIAEKGKTNSKPTTDNGHKKTVLIVEDNHHLRDYLKTILEAKYRVMTTENGQAGWELLNSQPNANNPQLIISDVMMPVMDGFQLLEKVKSSDQFRHIPMVMLTARAALEDKLKALRIGVDDYILKPFVEEELLTRVENLLQFRQERIQFLKEEAQQENRKGIHEKKMSVHDMKWLEELETITQKELGNFNFSVEQMAYEMALSRTQLFRKLKRLTGLSPQQYLKEAKLQQAKFLLENQKKGAVKAVAFAVGLRHTEHFSQEYKKRFGKLPSEYLYVIVKTCSDS